MHMKSKLLGGWMAMAAVTALVSGCDGEGSPSTTAAEADDSLVPTYAEVSAAVSLDDADAAVMKAALADWKEATANEEQPPVIRPRRGQMQFLADVAPSLDDSQLSKLVDVLVERRDALREEMRGRHGDGAPLKKLAGELGLTAEQQAAMKALHEETRAKMKEQHDAFSAGTITREQMHEVRKALHDAQREKLATILSTEQKTKLDALRDQRQDRHIDRRLERVGEHIDDHAAWLDAALNLSDAQAAQVRTALATFAATQKTALEAMKNDSITREQLHERMSTAHEALETAFEDLLTDQQSARLEIIHRLHPRGPHRG